MKDDTRIPAAGMRSRSRFILKAALGVVRRERLWPAGEDLLCGFFIAAAALLIALFLSVPATADPGDDLPKVLRAGFLARVFVDVDYRDAKAATEIIAREISRNMGLSETPRIIVYSNLKSMTDAVRRGEVDMVTLPSLDYLRVRDTGLLVPAVVGSHNNGKGSRFVLIARRDSGLRTVADLRGKSILLMPEQKHEASSVWLDVLIMKEGKTIRRNYFSREKESSRVSHSIMGVFFRQVDAAVVSRAAYETSKLLNPQIERELTFIRESNDLADGVTCFSSAISGRAKDVLLKAILKVNETPSGRQLYTIFQTSGTTPFKPSNLAGLEELLRERDRLAMKTAKRK
jgi:ABC-type phosphate/phosphonate transport system substrate-binding protein